MLFVNTRYLQCRSYICFKMILLLFQFKENCDETKRKFNKSIMYVVHTYFVFLFTQKKMTYSSDRMMDV